MKKFSLVLVAIVLIVIGLLPIVGNKFMQKYTEDTLALLSSQGLKLESMQTNSGYLHTQKHFEFVVEDSTAFVKYIDTHSSSQLLSVKQKRLDGTLIGVDLKYSNLPFAKSIDSDIYLIALPKIIQDKLKTEDINSYNKFMTFLKEKGVLYHIEYNLINSKFKSYLKDINQNYHLQNGSEVDIKLRGITFKGKGELLSPKSLSINIQTIYFDINQTGVEALLSLKEFHARNKFTSFSDYNSFVSLSEMRFLISGINDDVNISMKNLETSSNAVPKSEKVNMNSKTKLEAMYLSSKVFNIDVSKLESNVDVEGVDKNILEKMSTMVNKADDINEIYQQQEFQKIVIALLEKGFRIKAKNISFRSLIVDKTENLGGLKIDLDLDVKKDANLSAKMQKSPLFFLSNIMLHTNIKLSSAMYEKLLQNPLMVQKLSSYAKKEKDNVLFKIEFKDDKLYVNGKVIE